MTIRMEIILMNIFSLIVLSIAILILSSLSVNKMGKQWENSINSLPAQEETNAKSIVNFSMKSLLTLYEHGNKTGDTKTIKSKFMKLMSNMRYNNGKGYVWIVNYKGNVVFNSAFPGTVGKNLNAIKYTKNQGIADKIRKVVNSEAGMGSFKYLWPEPGSNKAVKKIGFLSYFEPYNWIIISGVYTNRINRIKLKNKVLISQFSRKQTLFLVVITLIIGIMVAILSVLLSRRILKPIQKISEEAGRMSKQIAEGEFAFSFDTDANLGNDEIGKMQLALYEFYSVLKEKLIAIQNNSREISSAAEVYSENSKKLEENMRKTAEVSDALKDTMQLLQNRSSKMPYFADNIKNAAHSINKLSAALPAVTHKVSERFVKMSGTISSMENLHQLFLNQIRRVEKIIKAIDFILDSASKMSFDSAGSKIAIEETMGIIGKLAKTHAKTKDDIKNALSKIKNETEGITDIMNNMIAGKEDVQTAMQDLSNRIDKFNDQTSSLNEPIEKLSENYDLISKTQQELDNYSSSLKTSLTQSMESISLINSAVGSLKSVVEELDKLIKI